MPIKISSAEKKAEIARDVVVAYLSHAKEDDLGDLDKVDAAIERLVAAVDKQFEVSDRPSAGFGIPPTIPQRTA